MCNPSSYASEHTDKLAKALIAVQAALQPAVRDSENAFIHNKYASLGSVITACRNLLTQNGIWLTQLPVPAPAELGPGYIGLVTKLTHAESGQWQSSYLVSPLPKNDPQGMGSALTYARRYSLVAMLGIIVDDDDAESACIRSNPQRQQAPANTQTVQTASQPVARLSTQDALPSFPGVTVERFTDANGDAWLKAGGETRPYSRELSQLGFRWNGRQKLWFKPDTQVASAM